MAQLERCCHRGDGGESNDACKCFAFALATSVRFAGSAYCKKRRIARRFASRSHRHEATSTCLICTLCLSDDYTLVYKCIRGSPACMTKSLLPDFAGKLSTRHTQSDGQDSLAVDRVCPCLGTGRVERGKGRRKLSVAGARRGAGLRPFCIAACASMALGTRWRARPTRIIGLACEASHDEMARVSFRQGELGRRVSWR